MGNKAKSSGQKVEAGKLVKSPRISQEVISQSRVDFERYFKPLFEEMEVWRKESASSQTRVA